jgi:hypothetical protein
MVDGRTSADAGPPIAPQRNLIETPERGGYGSEGRKIRKRQEAVMGDNYGQEFRMPQFEMPKGVGKKIVILGVVLAALFLLSKTVGTVGAGERGVLLRFSAVTDKVFEEGLYFKIPFVHQVVLMSTQIQKYTAPATSSSKDLQVVTTEVTLNYQLTPSQTGEIYRRLRRDYEARVIQPYIQEAVKSWLKGWNHWASPLCSSPSPTFSSPGPSSRPSRPR